MPAAARGGAEVFEGILPLMAHGEWFKNVPERVALKSSISEDVELRVCLKVVADVFKSVNFQDRSANFLIGYVQTLNPGTKVLHLCGTTKGLYAEIHRRIDWSE